ncbi:MAG: hypothetical protein HYZ43_12620, partial [Flavobacteriia bacterium]|nr:hypothetical protein [Flavobacteriia bacterium]
GGDNFTRFKITEELSKGHIKLIPDVLIGGNSGGGSAIDGLLGLKLMEMMDPEKKLEDKTVVIPPKETPLPPKKEN